MKAIKRCPFCGSDDLMLAHVKSKYWSAWYSCRKCKAKGPLAIGKQANKTVDRAEELWNKRTD